MSEIEKYYNGEIHVDFEEDDLIGEIIEQNNEIEKLHSIIKEVREYIDKFIKTNYEDIFNQKQKDYMIKILEILEGGKDTKL